MSDAEGTQKPNRLIHEKSPYLLQHAYNPVDWYPWGKEAFETAKRENKPVFLSIGYATCHWCHVMAHDSFEDKGVAALMNDAFINIKVDREERPDVDGVYMTVCQLTTGSGGWPLTVLMTPDKEPFFAGTFIPKMSQPNRIGMLDFVPRVKSIWENNPDEIANSAEQTLWALEKTVQDSGTESLDASILEQTYKQLAARFDSAYGGFGTRPKFPTPHQLTFLLRHWKRTGDAQALNMVEITLDQMRLGGVYDHIGFGFHRYSTDAKWLLPHFEKMLYDQAMLTIAYTEAFQVTGKTSYRQTVEEILTYVLRDMTSPEGGFYSAEDADSEGEEGKFYVWSEDELKTHLSADEAKLVINTFNTSPEGNFFEEASGHKTGTNILHLKEPLNDSDAELRAKIESIRQKLFAVRKERIHPLKDDKILTDWNGLMIAAFAKAAQVFSDARYVEAAEKSIQCIFDHLHSEGRLLHRYRKGESDSNAYLSDYAFFIWGLIEFYETTFDPAYLQKAVELNQTMIDLFWDEAKSGFFFTANDSEQLPVRQKEIYDGAIPSGNSVAMLNLLRLARLTGNMNWESKALEISRIFSEQVKASPSAFTQLFLAVDFVLGPSHEICLVGKNHDALNEMKTTIQQTFLPSKAVVCCTDDNKAQLLKLAPWIEHHQALDETATAYVCSNFQCQQPTTNLQVMLTTLS